MATPRSLRLMADSPKIKWPPFGSYVDEFGPIDGDVYAAAADLWPRAAAVARGILRDEQGGQVALLKVCARVTTARSAGRKIRNLKAYVSRAYKRELIAQLRLERLHGSLAARQVESSERSERDLEKQILLMEIIAMMDDPNRQIFEELTLGYSFEEIAKKQRRQSNVIRSAFSKQLAKIRVKLAEENEPESGDSDV